jgi:putative ABC transport system permease protein
MGSIVQDLRFGARMLLKQPGFTLIAVLTLALGVGANTAIFSVINAVLLSPLPYRNADRLTAIGQTSPRNRTALSSASHRNFLDWREQSKRFEDMAAYHPTVFTYAGREEAVRLRGTVVTHNLFSLLGASPAMGRAFLPDEDQSGGGAMGRPAILSWECWRQYFSGDRNIIGGGIRLDGESYTVIGVMPPAFAFPIEAQPTEIWTSTARDAENTGEGSIMVSRGYRTWKAIGRLKPGVSVAEAQAEMNVVADNLAAAYPQFNRDSGLLVLPLLDSLVRNVRWTLLLLLGSVACVLLIACLNVANLLLERAIERRKETAIRLALGASRRRIVAQLLTESLLLAGLGGLGGVALARWGLRLLLLISPEDIARLSETRLDARVLLFTTLSALLTGVLFGVAPALTASRTPLNEALKEGGRGAAGGAGLGRARGFLVVTEVALTLVLLVGGGLLIRSLMVLRGVELGFNPNNVLTFGVTATLEALGAKDYNDVRPEQVSVFYQRMEERLKSLPGVSGVSVASALPLSGNASTTGLRIEGRPEEPGRGPMGLIHSVGVDYFRVMGVPLRQGREFTPYDDLKTTPVIIINETLARRLFPNENPIGRRIEPSFSSFGEPVMREIIGVVGDTRHGGPQSDANLEIYFSQAQMPMDDMSVVLRTTTDPQGIANAARGAVNAFNKNAPVYRIRTLDHYLARVLAPQRFNMTLIGFFAVVALMLTAVGLYGVISCIVSQSRREIGVRRALGAQTRDILRFVIAQGMTLTLIGVALGLVFAFVVTRLMKTLLYGVVPNDPLTFVIVPVLILVVAFLACWLPARRAANVDPMTALRAE